MASISSPGIGSGIDVNTVVSQLVAVEKQPLQQLQKRASSINSQVSLYGQIKSQLTSFQDAATTLADPATWSSTTGSSSDATSLGVSASGTAVAGNYSVQVQSLASAQVASSALVSDPAHAGTGTLTIELGKWDAGYTNFQPGSQSALQIQVSSADDSLSSIAARINAAHAGVNASVITDANGSRLMMQSQGTGTANGFRIRVSDDDAQASDGAGLSRLAFDPANVTQAMSLNRSAVDAQVSINGLAVSSPSNTLSNVLPGVTLNLLKVSATPIGVSITQDKDSISQKIHAFVDAYNTVQKTLADATRYDAQTKVAGVLQADASTLAMQRALRGTMINPVAGAAYARLSAIGVDFKQDGSLSINDPKLQGVMTSSMTAMQDLLAGSTAPAIQGVGQRAKSFLTSMLGTGGVVESRTQGLQKSVTLNANEQQRVNDRAAVVEKRLREQYTALDKNMAKLNALNTYVTQQITQWNKNTA